MSTLPRTNASDPNLTQYLFRLSEIKRCDLKNFQATVYQGPSQNERGGRIDPKALEALRERVRLRAKGMKPSFWAKEEDLAKAE